MFNHLVCGLDGRIGVPRRVAISRALAGLTALGLLLGVGAGAATADDKAEVQIYVIRATKSNDDISPELKSLADALKKQFRFTGYKLEKKLSHGLSVGETWKTELIGGYKAEITLKSAKDKDISLDATILNKKGEKKLNSPLTIARGRSQLIGGQKLDGDDVLILAVSGK